MPERVVFVHGWSVTHTNTYGALPTRLVSEAAAHGISLSVQHIFLGKYVSFHDEVRVPDLALAMEYALQDAGLNTPDKRFYCVTHSTGGPVVRAWYDRYYRDKTGSPMSHLVMLAPANFGSALAALGKARVGRIKAWFDNIEPGQGVLDWLSLGSREALALNTAWLEHGNEQIGPKKMFPFVLTGQCIDRKLYDNLNSYTGELGSDGVVRAAAAHLNATWLRLKQGGEPDSKKFTKLMQDGEILHGPDVPFRIISGVSHSGKQMGIMRSVSDTKGGSGQEVIDAILRCFSVSTAAQYKKLSADFAQETDTVQTLERVEKEQRLLLGTRTFYRDRHAQVIFRVRDSEGEPVADFDLLLTAGDASNPNHLPEGFFRDRQANSAGVFTYFLNYDVLAGCPAIPGERDALPGIDKLGLEIHPRPTEGFVHFRKSRVAASAELLQTIVKPNQTTIVDITLTRVVHEGAFRFEKTTEESSFKNVRPGRELN